MLLSGSDQLVRDRGRDPVEALVVVATEKDREEIWRDDAAHADRAPKVHLPREPSAEFDGLEFAPESLRERTLDQTFEPVLELLESHVGTKTT